MIYQPEAEIKALKDSDQGSYKFWDLGRRKFYNVKYTHGYTNTEIQIENAKGKRWRAEPAN